MLGPKSAEALEELKKAGEIEPVVIQAPPEEIATAAATAASGPVAAIAAKVAAAAPTYTPVIYTSEQQFIAAQSQSQQHTLHHLASHPASQHCIPLAAAEVS